MYLCGLSKTRGAKGHLFLYYSNEFSFDLLQFCLHYKAIQA